MKILLTGCAGFIGAAVAKVLLAENDDTTVIGIDNINDYYDVKLKYARLNFLKPNARFHFYQSDLKESATLFEIFAKHKPDIVLHLAAQAGVRYSLENPATYVDSNLVGFCNMLDACRRYPVQHFVFASSSSVYGANSSLPYSVHDSSDHPLSLYAATKKANELLAHSHSHLYDLPVTGLRYFTVYGPWGRPDMTPIKFVQHILAEKPIQVFNHGHHQRDFTYIDDIVEGTKQVLFKPPLPDPNWCAKKPDPASSHAPYRIYNIGYGKPMELLHFIELLEENLGRKAIKEMVPKQPGDVDVTWADTLKLESDVGYKPKISLQEGISRFVHWYKGYYL